MAYVVTSGNVHGARPDKAAQKLRAFTTWRGAFSLATAHLKDMKRLCRRQ
jgi:hypothetical protein